MLKHIIPLLICVLLLISAGIKNPRPGLPAEKDPVRGQLVQIMRSFLGNNQAFLRRNGKVYPNDCSGMVRAAYDSIGIDVFYRADKYPGLNGVKIIYNTFKKYSWTNRSRLPRPGDLIFFNNTYDKNKNQKWDDRLTHVSLVEGVVTGTKTVSYVHHVRAGVQRYMLDLSRPKDYMYKGRVVNNFLRRARSAADQQLYNKKSSKGRHLYRYRFCSAYLHYCYVDVLKAFPEIKNKLAAIREDALEAEIKEFMERHRLSKDELIRKVKNIK